MNRYFAGTLHRSKTSEATWLMQFEKNEQCDHAGHQSGEVASTPRPSEDQRLVEPAYPAGRSWARLDLDRDGERSLPEQERRSRRVRIADVGQEHAKRGATPRSLLHPGATAVHPRKADH
jgi:hypothetical protein